MHLFLLWICYTDVDKGSQAHLGLFHLTVNLPCFGGVRYEKLRLCQILVCTGGGPLVIQAPVSSPFVIHILLVYGTLPLEHKDRDHYPSLGQANP